MGIDHDKGCLAPSMGGPDRVSALIAGNELKLKAKAMTMV